MNAYKKLVELVFDKAKRETHHETITQQAKHVVNEIENKFSFSISDKTLRNYYNDLIKGKKPNVIVNRKIADHLSLFLGVEDYTKFVEKNLTSKKKKFKKKITKESVLITSLLVFASYFGFDSMSKKCMSWIENYKYEKINCEESNTIPIDEFLLNNFKRVEPDCNYVFFKDDGMANLWYGKSIKGKYEFFNHLGVHPITGKTLKEISTYMIKHHICKTD